MKRQTIFTFRVNQEERQLISRLSEILKRSQSDAVRFVVTAAASELSLISKPNKPPAIYETGPHQ